MLNENDSHYLYNDLLNNARMQNALDIVKGTGAVFGIDGDRFYYGFGHIAESTGVYGFGTTPSGALDAFAVAYYSQTVNPPSTNQITPNQLNS
jgi:hypothetical protein